MSRERSLSATGVDPWFLRNIEELIEMEQEIASIAEEIMV